MQLNLNSRQLQLEILKDLDFLLNAYVLEENPLTLRDIFKVDLYYSPIDDFYKFYAEVANYKMDLATLRYFKNQLYLNKGTSKIFELIKDSLSSKNTIFTPTEDIITPVNFEYEYDFPDLKIEIEELTSDMIPSVFMDKFITMLIYLIFYNDETLEIILDKLRILIHETLLNYMEVFNITNINLNTTLTNILNFNSPINNTFNEFIV